jgi:hypothetical protein
MTGVSKEETQRKLLESVPGSVAFLVDIKKTAALLTRKLMSPI